MSDQQFRAMSSCLVIASLMVVVTAQKNGPEKGKLIVVTQLIYENNETPRVLFNKQKTYAVFPSSDINTSGSLGEREKCYGRGTLGNSKLNRQIPQHNLVS